MKPSPKMNINKKNNGGWILCSSKSIPGKYYYFNVVTGEAVWSLSDTESKFLKKGSNIERVVDRMHNYPEPVSPPKENTYTPSNYYPRSIFTPESHQIQSFGNAIFPKYISNIQPSFSNIIWTPIQMPMFVANTPEVRKQMLDQNTQTSELERNTLVQTCSMPLSQRFAQFGTNITLNKNNNFLSGKPLQSSTPIKNWWGHTENLTFISKSKKTDDLSPELQYKRKLDEPKLILKESKLKRFKTLSETDCGHQTGLSSNNDIDYESMGKTSLWQGDKVENEKISPEKNSSVEKLDKNDLRFLLQLKRRKSVDLGVLYNEKQKEETNKITKGTTKKKVSFNLTNISDDNSSIDGAKNKNNKEVKTPVSIKYLKQLNQTKNKEWYISVDEDVVLDEYDFITDYIAKDDLCKLLIPDSMVKYIESLGMGEHGGRSRVLVARQVYRRLTTSEQAQIFEVEDGASLMDDMIKCCLRVMNMDFHVVIITKYVKLEKIAKSYGIHVYTLDDIKNGVTDNKLKEFGCNTNLFLQNEDDFDPFILSKSVTPVNTLKKTVFNYNDDYEASKINHSNKKFATDNNEHFYLDGEDCYINIDNNSIDLLNIEKLKINDEKLNNIKIVINTDNSKAKEIITIGNSDKTKQFKSIFDHINTENVQFNKKNYIIDNTKTNEKNNLDNTNKTKPFRSIFDHIDTENVQFNRNNYLSKTITNNDKLHDRHTKRDFDNKYKETINYQFETIRKSTVTPKQNINDDKGVEKTHIFEPKVKEINVVKYTAIDSIEDRLKEFYVKDKIVEFNISMRCEEWLCCYVQIMEDFIDIILQNDPNNSYQVPYFLRDGLVYLKEIYFNTKEIKIIVEKLLALCGFCLMKEAFNTLHHIGATSLTLQCCLLFGFYYVFLIFLTA